jgi:hypothetical protein
MITLRHADERGHADHGWLTSRHSFSFGNYYDPAHMGFRALRVINDDHVVPGAGFGEHGHRDMEILTYVLDGALEHRDSLGNGSVIRAGDVQRMTAGTGVTHSEYNHSQSDRVSFLQIWITPEEKGLPPGYAQRNFPDAEKRGALRLLASRDKRDASLLIHQDAEVYAALLSPGETLSHRLAPGRHVWLHVVQGALDLNGHALRQGDGAAVSGEDHLEIVATAASEFLLFDLA